MPLFLLLDTNVYINRAAGRFSQRVCDTIDKARCSIVRLRWRNLRAVSPTLFANIPCSRLVTPDAQVWADAGVIAGTLARSQGFQPHQRKECLNDALIFLTAAKAGIPVLTANRSEFDLIQQLAPEGQFVHC
jgi:predicted nucleic acid-binding protein